jgi:hypothetical protein
MIEIIVLVVMVVGLIAVFFVLNGTLNLFVFMKFNKDVRKRFSHHLLQVLDIENSNIDIKIEKITFYYYKLREKFPDQSSYLKSTSYLLEEILYFLDFYTYDLNLLKKRLGMEEENIGKLYSKKEEIRELLSFLKNESEELLETVSPKTANLFKEMKLSIQEKNSSLSLTTLNKLIKEFNDIENHLISEKKKSNRLGLYSLILTIVGIVISIMSFFV